MMPYKESKIFIFGKNNITKKIFFCQDQKSAWGGTRTLMSDFTDTGF